MDIETYPLFFSEPSEQLIQENKIFCHTTGASSGNQSYGFTPAFLDFETGVVHLSRFKSGQPAPIHLYDGLPDSVVTQRDPSNKPTAVKSSVISGFVLNAQFYTREQTIEVIKQLEKE